MLRPEIGEESRRSFFMGWRIKSSMDIDEILRIRERIEDSRRRVAAALDSARASHRLMSEMREKLERHLQHLERHQVSLAIWRSKTGAHS
jgi:hypothetical protein